MTALSTLELSLLTKYMSLQIIKENKRLMRDGKRTKVMNITTEIHRQVKHMWNASNTYLTSPDSKSMEHIKSHHKAKERALQQAKYLVELLENDRVVE